MINKSFEFLKKRKDKLIKVLLLIMIFCLMTIIPATALGDSSGSKDARKNMFYIQILNYTLPVVETSVFNSEDLAENSSSFTALKNNLINFLGLNVEDPKTAMEKEISSLKVFSEINNVKMVENAVTYEPSNDVQPYKISQEEITKEPENNANTDSDNTDSQIIDEKINNVYNPSIKKTLNLSKPEVFIYHTHTSESYKPGGFDNPDQTKNVCAVGDELMKELQDNYGIAVIHDKTVHDIVYNDSYSRSSATVSKYLKQYKDFRLIIDMHRDSSDGKNPVSIKLNGETISRYMFVMCKKNPHFNKNMELVNKLYKVSENLFPKLCKEIFYYNYGTRYFNQALSNNSVLIEVGNELNSTDESKATAKYLARVIAETLHK